MICKYIYSLDNSKLEKCTHRRKKKTNTHIKVDNTKKI